MKVVNAGAYFWVVIKKPVCIKAQQQDHYSHVSTIFNTSIKVKIRLIKKNCKGTFDLSFMNLCNLDILLSSSNTSNLFTSHRLLYNANF